MNDEQRDALADQDIFGKIDALLGKRAGFSAGSELAEKPVEEDFPLLTEVVAQSAAEPAPHLAVDALRSEAFARQQPDVSGELDAAGRIVAIVEARLTKLFSRQQQDLEALVRRIVREELARERGKAPQD